MDINLNLKSFKYFGNLEQLKKHKLKISGKIMFYKKFFSKKETITAHAVQSYLLKGMYLIRKHIKNVIFFLSIFHIVAIIEKIIKNL